MKCYYQLECNNLKDIVSQTLNYLSKNTTLLDPNTKTYWNKINTVDLVRHVPALMEYFKTLNLKLREVAVLVANENVPGIPLHVDEGPLITKINIPILNTKNVFTSWRDIPPSVIDQLPTMKNAFQVSVPDFTHVDHTQYPLLAEIELTQPIVFNSSIPHMVKVTEDTVYPRIVLACMFHHELTSYLDGAR